MIQVVEEGLARELLRARRPDGLGATWRTCPPRSRTRHSPRRSARAWAPYAVPQGFTLLLVEESRPAELNEATRRLIRKHLYDDWVNEQLTTLRFDLSWLKDHSAGDGRPEA